ncbi:MAG TPA: energy-coupling factor transporter transmembrane component T [Clostridia bacterium]|nr:energy-coupling factor transporter transmembrane component T [Clostridia bacterium]
MIKDITLGQYFPGESAVHKLDPRMKIVLTCVYMVVLFCAFNAWGLVLSGLFMVAVILISRIPVRLVFKSVKPIVPVIIITSLINAFYIPGRSIFKFYFMNITLEGVEMAVFMSVRIVFLIVGTSMMTYTTSPISLTDGLERLMAPLKAMKLPVHELSMMMTIALRFIPTLIEETDKIMSAQKARGADFESGNLMRRMKALLPILIPLFVSAFRRAEELALAMDCRCYKGGEGRTRMRQLRMTSYDYSAAGLFTLLLGGVIALNLLAPSLIK